MVRCYMIYQDAYSSYDINTVCPARLQLKSKTRTCHCNILVVRYPPHAARTHLRVHVQLIAVAHLMLTGLKLASPAAGVHCTLYGVASTIIVILGLHRHANVHSQTPSAHAQSAREVEAHSIIVLMRHMHGPSNRQCITTDRVCAHERHAHIEATIPRRYRCKM